MSYTYCKLLQFPNYTVKFLQISKCTVDYMLKKVYLMVKNVLQIFKNV